MTYGTLPSHSSMPSIRARPHAQMFRQRRSSWNPSLCGAAAPRSRSFMALVELGVKTWRSCRPFCRNRPEWHTADFAINAPAASQSHLFSRIAGAHNLHPQALWRARDHRSRHGAIANAIALPSAITGTRARHRRRWRHDIQPSASAMKP